MKSVMIVNRTRDSVLGSKVGVADRWWLRARGFLRRPEPRDGEGLLLSPCRAVHMVGMGFALDIVFIDRLGKVLAVYPNLVPGRRSSWHYRARYALELPVGSIEATGTAVGDLIAWLPFEANGNGNGVTPLRTSASASDNGKSESPDRVPPAAASFVETHAYRGTA